MLLTTRELIDVASMKIFAEYCSCIHKISQIEKGVIIYMNKKDIIKAIVDKHADFTQKEVGIIVDEFLDVIQDEISKGQKVSLAKFGTFEVVHRPAREGRNPQTGEPMTIAASDSPKFKPAKAFKDFVNM